MKNNGTWFRVQVSSHDHFCVFAAIETGRCHSVLQDQSTAVQARVSESSRLIKGFVFGFWCAQICFCVVNLYILPQL